MFIKILRNNIGTIIAACGFVLLTILTFGDLGNIMTDQYWQNVKENLTSIGLVSISLTLIQVAIKQGLAEQALQKGLNTDKASAAYMEHRDLIKECTDKMVFLPYFLQSYNDRHTLLRKREFLVNNNYSTEKMLRLSGKRRLIRKYDSIHTNVTATRIKWATTDVTYNKKGQIETLGEHRAKRSARAVINSLLFMVGATFLTRGLFFVPGDEPIWQKFVKLLSYALCIAISSILSVIKEYEKGAFGVPNELDEINEIWREFKEWKVPQWVIDEVNELDEKKEAEKNEQREEINDSGADIQIEQNEVESVQDAGTDNVLDLHSTDDNLLRASD